MFLLFYRYLCGYLYVRVTSPSPERILNLCAAKGITVWRVLLRGDKLYFKIGISAFRRLRVLKRHTPGKIHITRKVGLPFILSRNRRRYGMLIGLLVFFGILQFMSGFVWNICVSGNQTVQSVQITDCLRTVGVHEGARVSQIVPGEARNELLLNMKTLSWAAVNIEGCYLTVDVIETKFENENEQTPSNLMAKYDGIVKKIEVIKGTAQVKTEEAVHKGQLLVSGMVEYKDLTTGLQRARGKIYAETALNFTAEQPKTVTEQLRTGQKERRSILKLFGFNIPLYLGKINYPYESLAPATQISSGKTYLPVCIYTRDFYRTRETTYTLSDETAKERAKQTAEKQMREVLENGEILHKKEHWSEKNGKMIYSVEVKCLLDITYEEKIRLDTRNS